MTSHILPSLSTRVTVPQQSEYQSCGTPLFGHVRLSRMCDLADRPSWYEQAPARRTGASDLAPYAQARTFLTDTYARRRNAVDCSVVDSAGTPPVPPTTVPCARQGLGIMQAWMQTERSRNWAHRVSLLAPGAAFLGEHHAVARLCRDVLPHVHHPVSMHSILLGVPRGCRPNSRLGYHHRGTPICSVWGTAIAPLARPRS